MKKKIPLCSCCFKFLPVFKGGLCLFYNSQESFRGDSQSVRMNWLSWAGHPRGGPSPASVCLCCPWGWLTASETLPCGGRALCGLCSHFLFTWFYSLRLHCSCWLSAFRFFYIWVVHLDWQICLYIWSDNSIFIKIFLLYVLFPQT